MLRKILLFISSLALPVVFSGCFVLNLFDFGPDVELGEHQWKIASFNLGGEIYESENLEQTPTMRFDTQELKLYGNTGCNTFFANYVWLSDKVIEMRNSGMTRKMCASQESMKFEQKLMEEFDGEFEVVEDGKNVTLKKETLIINLIPYDPSNPSNQDEVAKPQEETPSQNVSATPAN